MNGGEAVAGNDAVFALKTRSALDFVTRLWRRNYCWRQVCISDNETSCESAMMDDQDPISFKADAPAAAHDGDMIDRRELALVAVERTRMPMVEPA